VDLEETIAAIEGSRSLDELRAVLQRTAENYGFAAFDFIDVGQPHLDLPFHSGTSGKRWEQEYISNKFLHVDPCITKTRRTNVPFIWGSIRLEEHHVGRKPGALRTFEAAWDHGFTEGLVVPCHHSDEIGRRIPAQSRSFGKIRFRSFGFS
jgi:hypothetical protein